MNKTLIDSTESLKRYAKVSSKIQFKLNLGTVTTITVPTLKGDFLKLLADVPPSPVSAEFDGDTTTIFGGITLAAAV